MNAYQWSRQDRGIIHSALLQFLVWVTPGKGNLIRVMRGENE